MKIVKEDKTAEEEKYAYVPLSECEELIKEAYRVTKDDKYSYNTKELLRTLNNATYLLSKYGNIQKFRLETIERWVKYYRNIINLNSKLDDSFRKEYLDALNNAYNFINKNRKLLIKKLSSGREYEATNREIGGYTSNIKRDANDILNGNYVIEYRLLRVLDVLKQFDELKGVTNSRLSKTFSGLVKKIEKAKGLETANNNV